MAIETRIEALSLAVRVSLAHGNRDDTDEQIVARAEAFEKFLSAK